MKNSYEVLDLQPTATMEEVEAKYRSLKEEYGEKRFETGEIGNVAACKLTEIEAAYQDIKAEREQTANHSKAENPFAGVEAALKSGDVAKAQTLLDMSSDRNAEWHYLQSYVYYKKNWMNESKRQLEIAMDKDPRNEKYKNAYEKLVNKMRNAEASLRASAS